MRRPSSIRLLICLGATLSLTVCGVTDASNVSKSPTSHLSHHRPQVHATVNQQSAHRSDGWMILPVCLMVVGYSMRRQQRSLNWHQPLTV